jgi:DNA-binding NarL/FixJ family response regulator
MADLPTLRLEAEATFHPGQTSELGVCTLRIGLVDCHRLSRECLVSALERHDPQIDLFPFGSVQKFVSEDCSALDLVIYYPHSCDPLEEVLARDVGTMRQALPGVPIVVLSDVEEAHQPKTIRSTLSSGAHGFIPTRTTGIPIAIAAIRFVKAGGTFAPIDQLLSDQSMHTSMIAYAAPQVPLTSRQMAVFSHLRQGKANKIIAYELDMSESTVKVHIRNIMRKTGATNRTQAAYKAQQLWSSMEFNRVSDL